MHIGDRLESISGLNFRAEFDIKERTAYFQSRERSACHFVQRHADRVAGGFH